MAFDLATAKLRLGSPATVADAVIQAGLNTALAVAERYCDRTFMYQAETARFYYWTGAALQLPRYPVEQVIKMTGTNTTTTYKLHHQAGQLEFPRQVHFEDVSITYAGGYKTLPLDLELALFLIFDNVYQSQQPTGGAGASVGGSGAITSITVPDVGRLSFADPNAGSSSSGGVGLIPGTAIDLLAPYRAQPC